MYKGLRYTGSMSEFWDTMLPDSTTNELDSRIPRQRMKILIALQDPETFGEWNDPRHSAYLYGPEEGVVVYCHDSAMELLLNQFFESKQCQTNWIEFKKTLIE